VTLLAARTADVHPLIFSTSNPVAVGANGGSTNPAFIIVVVVVIVVVAIVALIRMLGKRT
jgi:hypothetical protein